MEGGGKENSVHLEETVKGASDTHFFFLQSCHNFDTFMLDALTYLDSLLLSSLNATRS